MFASTHVLTAGPEPPGPEPMFAVAGLVSRVSETPPTVRDADAFAVVLPPSELVITSVHSPFASVVPVPAVPLAAPHVPPTRCEFAPLEFAIDVVTVTPAAGCRPLPSPASALTLTVNVCVVPTSFVASGTIRMFASTHVFTAGPDPFGPA